MSKIPVTYKRTDLQSDQEVKWCPGCGDYTILASVQNFMAEMGISKEKIVFVSGIGCAARFPYYMNTYGVHSIHGFYSRSHFIGGFICESHCHDCCRVLLQR